MEFKRTVGKRGYIFQVSVGGASVHGIVGLGVHVTVGSSVEGIVPSAMVLVTAMIRARLMTARAVLMAVGTMIRTGIQTSHFTRLAHGRLPAAFKHEVPVVPRPVRARPQVGRVALAVYPGITAPMK